MLVKSGRFQESDIEIHTVPLNLCIHQYLRVRIADDLTIDADPWAHFLNIPLGQKCLLLC